MAKILIVGDFHLHNFQQFSTIDPKTGLNSRFAAGLDLLYWIIELSRKVDYVIFLGDIFHSRKAIAAEVLSLTVEAFREFSKPVIALCGNHDLWGKDASETTLRALPTTVDVITNPRDIYLPEAHVTLGFHPYTKDLEAFKSWCRRSHDLDMACLHQGLDEASLGAFNATINAGLSVKDLPESRLIFAGHYHKHQRVGKNTYYAGSVFQCDFGEREEPKMVHIVDTQTWEFTSIPTEAPNFHLYHGLAAAKNGKHKESDFIRIVVSPKEAEQAKAEFPTAQLEIEKILTKEKRVIPQEANTSDPELLRAYLEDRKVSLDPERILKLGIELLESE